MPSSASAPTEIYTLSLHDALPICRPSRGRRAQAREEGGREARRPAGSGGLASAVPRHQGGHPHEEESRQGHTPDPLFQLRRLRPHRSEEHTSELQSRFDLVCRLLLPRPPRSTLFPYTTLFRSAGLPEDGELKPAKKAAEKPADLRALEDSLQQSLGTKVVIRTKKNPAKGTLQIHFFSFEDFDRIDRKSTRLNSSHVSISYAVFCFRAHRDLHSFPTRRSSDLPAFPRTASSSPRRRRPRSPPTCGLWRTRFSSPSAPRWSSARRRIPPRAHSRSTFSASKTSTA